MKSTRLIIFALLCFHFVTNAQEEAGADWPTLVYSENQAGLEANPLKGIAANFGSNNDFPYSISNVTYTFGELVKDELLPNGKPDFNFQIIDMFLDTVAQKGHVGMIQINLDNGIRINPLEPSKKEPGYVGEKDDLPDFLKTVNRIYYQGRPKKTSAEGVEPETFEEQITDPSKNVFPWDVPGQTETEFFGDFAGNASMLPDYNDENLLKAIEDLIAALSARYDNDDRLFIVHYGIYGIYGEWDLGAAKVYIDDLVDEGGNNLELEADDWKMTTANQERIINAYQTSFTKTNLVARTPNLPEPESVGFSDGLFFGGSVSNDPEFEFFFHPTLKKFNVDKNWKNNIIGGEMDPALQPTIWGRDMGVRDDFDFIVNGDPDLTKGAPDQNVAAAFDFIHPTFIFQNFMLSKQFIGATNGADFGRGDDNPDKNPDPANSGPNTVMWENGLKVNKKLGYTFHINKYQLSATASTPIVEVNIQNKGIAPMYADWAVEFGYLVDDNFVTLGTATDWSLSDIQPQLVEGIEVAPNNYRSHAAEIEFPNANGTYTIGLRIINPLKAAYPNSPWVAFANETQSTNEGWLTLGEVTIVDGESETDTPIEVTSVETTPVDRNINMIFYDRIELAATAMPDGANTDIIWESSNPNLAAVDSYGAVTTNTIAGEVKITAFTSNPEVKAVFAINVAPFILVSNTNGESVTVEAEDYLTLFGTDDNNSVFDDPGVGGFIDGEGEVVRFVQNLKPNSYIDYGVSAKGGAQDFTIEFDYNAIFSGKFDLQIKNANASDTEFKTFSRISLPTLLQSDEIPLKADGDVDFDAGSKIYKTFASEPFLLENGEYIIRFRIIDTGFNLDTLTFSTVDICAQVPTPVSGATCDDGNPTTFDDVYDENCRCTGTPRSAIANTIPGRVEAEDYLTSFKISEGANFDAAIVENFTPESYLDYKVNVLNPDILYAVQVNAASSMGFEGKGELQIQLLNEDNTTVKETILESLEIMETENWNTYGDSNTSIGFNLPAGEHILRLRSVGNSTKFNLDWIEFKEADVASEYTAIPNLGDEVIEAESFSNSINGKRIDSNLAEESGENITALGFIVDGDLFEYNVNVKAGGGDFVLDFRAKNNAATNNAKVDILDANNTVLTQASFTIEGGSFDVYTSDDSFTLAEGDQTIILRVTASAFNLDWIKFREVEVTPEYTAIPNLGDEVIEAESFSNSIDGNRIDSNLTEESGENITALGFIVDGDLFEYNVNVKAGGGDFVLDFRAKNNAASNNAKVDILDANNTVLTQASFTIEGGSFDVYTSDDSFTLAEGNQTITLRVTASAFNLDWIKFREVEVTPEYTAIPNLGDEVIEAESFSNSIDGNRIDSNLTEESGENITALGFIVDGDLFEYNVNVKAGGGDFVLDFRAKNNAATNNAKVDILDANNTVLTQASFTIEGGSFDVYTSDDSFTLAEGNQTITLRVTASAFNLDWIQFKTTEEIDTTKPVLTLIGDTAINLITGDIYEELGATAVDTKDGDLTSLILVGGDLVDTSLVGSYVITYDVSDAAGNPADQLTRKVTISEVPDTEVPVITLIGDSVIELFVNDTYEEFSVTAIDSKDGDLTNQVMVGGDVVDTNIEGVYIVTYDVSDAAGNDAAQVARTVNVIEITVPPAELSVTRFILVDADSDQDIKEFVEGDVLDISELSSDNLSIRVETTDDVASVAIALSGPVSKTKNESYRPFALFGDSSNGTDFAGRTFDVGSYTISADTYSVRGQKGTKGNSLSLNFELINTNPTPLVLNVTRFILVDADSDQDIKELVEGDVLDISELSSDNLSIRVETTDDVASVAIALSGPVSKTKNESYRPFALFGDSSNGTDFAGRTFDVGSYTISADTYSVRRQKGTKGNSLSLNFELINTNTTPIVLNVTRFILVDADSDQDIKELVEGDVLDISELSSDNLSIRVETTDDVASVAIALSGPISKTKNESYRPFTLFGDSSNGTDFAGRTFDVGSYTISADTYSVRRQKGTKGNSLSVNFSLVSGISSLKGVSANKSLNNLTLYPNAASFETTLSFDQPTTVGDIQIFDVTGRLIRTIKGGLIDKQGTPLNVQEMKAGLYFVKTMDTNGMEFQQRLLIER